MKKGYYFNCDMCGKSSYREKSESHFINKFCSMKCFIDFKRKRQPRTQCAYCKKEIQVNPYRLNRFTNLFCSDQCQFKFQNKRELFNCFVCKKQVERSKSRNMWTSKDGKYFKTESAKRFCSSRCRNVWWNAQGKNKDTAIERKLEEELKKLGVEYKKNCPLLGITYPDFYIPSQKIAIYVDGKYWHSTNKVIEKDRNQVFVLTFNGYRVFRFSEDEVNDRIDKCISQIRAALPSLEYGRGVLKLAEQYKSRGIM